MGEGIYGDPNEYDAGLNFDYSVWTADTTLDLVNVNWNNDYRDVVKFANRTALNDYIDSLSPAGVKITKTTYAKPNQDIFLPVPYNRINRYNYLRASNPLTPIPNDAQKDYYYFILECEMVNMSTTRIRLQLDVWQTYVYDVTFGNCYVERGHIGIANENQFNNYGRDYLTVPEGLDLGAEYRTIVKRTEEIMSLTGTGGNFTYEHDIIVVSTTDLLAAPGTVEDPNFVTGPGSLVQGMPSGATFYVFNSASNFSSWLTSMKDYSWVTQGIVSVTVMPKMSRYNDFTYTGGSTPQKVNIRANPITYNMFNDWRNNAGFLNYIPAKYRHLKKFFTAPYMVIELTTWSATPVVLRPEAWNNADARVMERTTYMPPSQRTQIIPRGYNASGQTPEAFFGLTYDEFVALVNALPATPEEKAALIARYGDLGDDFGDYLDVMTQIANFPALPVVNNMAIGYLAANTHSIAYQRQSADWTQQRAMGIAQGQYDIAQRGIEATRALTDISTSAALAQTASQNTNLQGQALVSALSSMGGGVAGGSMLGPAGAALGGVGGTVQGIANGVNAGLQSMRNDEATAISNAQAWQTTGTQNRQSNYVANTNQNLAEFASKGDYANAIAGINARVQDAAMIQPSIAGQFGGDAANIAHGTLEFSVRWKLIDEANIKVIGDYWLQFGYAIRAFMTPPQSLRVMSKFSYWKMNQTYISGATVPENHKQSIRGILEKGVIVWVNPDDIGNIDIGDNTPLAGVSY